MTDLAYLPATTALSLFRSGELSPVELTKAVIERAERVEPTINALAERSFEQAVRAARESADRYSRGDSRPLEGIPVALKEEQPVAGRALREGSTLLRDNVSEVSHPIVERIESAGGVLHARTTTPEFCTAGFTHSDLWGTTHNAWNPRFSSGGSSGGSGAALAAGATTLATGSDIGGSIRIPASFNGVVGFKPPYGRVSALPPSNLDHFCHDGPMARTVRDCALLQNVITGRHPLDAAALPAPAPLPTESVGAAGNRIALCVHLGDYPVESEVVTATRQAAEVLREAGARVDEIELPWTRARLMSAAWAHYGSILAPNIDETLTEVGGTVDETLRYTNDFYDRSVAAFAKSGRYQPLLTEAEVYSDLADVFEWADALICPTSGVPAFPAGEDYLDNPLVVDGVRLDHHLEAPLTVPFNIASRCPVLSVPSGRASTGVPIGLQIVARPYDDPTVFAIGDAVYAARDWYQNEDHRPAL